jgi:hypothetical protein
MSAKDAVIEFVRGLPDGLSPAEILAEASAEFGLPAVPGEPVPEAEAEASWAAVINRRVEEARNGTAKLIPAEEMFPELNDPER